MKLLSLFSIFSAAAAWTVPSTSPALFLMHGYSVVIFPNGSHPELPSESNVVTANFYSYATPHGYLSFGWWLPPTNPTNHSHCSPSPPPNGFDWFEYSTGTCTPTSCKVHCVNYGTKEAGKGTDYGKPFLDDDYIVNFMDIGPGPEGKMHAGYFDKPGGGYAVGKMQVLSLPTEAGGSVETVRACHQAFNTMVEIQKERRLPLVFDLRNPCPRSLGTGSQVVLGLEEL